MAPTRVGIIGLRAIVQEGYTPGTWGLQHLNSLIASPHYEITAVCNTTTESAQKAINIHGLTNAKAYGSPEDIAADPNVDLVLVSVDVSKHVALMEPALNHKKHVFVEFPVAPTASEVRDLAALAEKNGLKVIAGSQARADPIFRKLQNLIKSGEIGDVVSTTMVGHIPIVTADGWPHIQKDFLDVDTGISRSKGVLGHILDAYNFVLGNFKIVQSILKVQDKTSRTVDGNYNVVDPAYPVTAPDTIFIQGVLEKGGVASLTLRSIRTAVDDCGFRWIISGTKGEIELTTKPGVLAFLPPGESHIRMRKWKSDAYVVPYDTDEGEHIRNIPPPGINVARVWEAVAKGDKDGYASIDDSLKTHELLEKIHRDAIWAP